MTVIHPPIQDPEYPEYSYECKHCREGRQDPDHTYWVFAGWDAAATQEGHVSEAIAYLWPDDRPHVEELAWFRLGFARQRAGERRDGRRTPGVQHRGSM